LVVWWLLMVGAVVAGWLIAESRGVSGVARAEYALNWFPAWLLTLPARADCRRGDGNLRRGGRLRWAS
jgi:hypothetical protein